MTGALKDKHFLVLIACISLYILISLFRLGDVPPPWYDEIAHLNTASHVMAEGRMWCDFYEGRFGEKILFNSMPIQWFLLAGFAKLFGLSVFSGRLLYVILSAVTVTCVFFIGRQLLSRSMALFGAVILMCTFLFFHISRQVIPQVPALAFQAAALCLFLFAEKNGRKVYFFGTGMLAGSAYLSHPIGLSAFLVIIILSVTGKAGIRNIIICLAGFAAVALPYFIYVVAHFSEYMFQTNFVLKGVYPVQPLYMTVLDEISVRYMGLDPVSNASHNMLVDGTLYNSYLYSIIWRLQHIDLRILAGEITGKFIFIISFLYVLLWRRKGNYRLLVMTFVPAALLSVHPNKFGPYLYVVTPFFILCFTILLRDLLSKKKVLPGTAGVILITLFFLSNPLFIAKELVSRKVQDYQPYIQNIKRYIEKGAIVCGSAYFWPGLQNEYRFISSGQIIYYVDACLKEKYERDFGALTDREQEGLIEAAMKKFGVSYVLLTVHYWEDMAEARGLTKGFGKCLRRYLFLHGEKKVDFCRERFYPGLGESKKFEDEVYEPAAGSEGFQNVGGEYQDSLKIYKLK